MRHANPCLGRFLAQGWQASRGSSHCDRDDEKDDGVDDGDNDGVGDDGDDDDGDNNDDDNSDGVLGTRIASNPIEARATVIRMMMLIYIMPMRGFGTKIPQFCQTNDPKHRAPKPATSSVSLRLGRCR